MTYKNCRCCWYFSSSSPRFFSVHCMQLFCVIIEKEKMTVTRTLQRISYSLWSVILNDIQQWCLLFYLTKPINDNDNNNKQTSNEMICVFFSSLISQLQLLFLMFDLFCCGLSRYIKKKTCREKQHTFPSIGTAKFQRNNGCL